MSQLANIPMTLRSIINSVTMAPGSEQVAFWNPESKAAIVLAKARSDDRWDFLAADATTLDIETIRHCSIWGRDSTSLVAKLKPSGYVPVAGNSTMGLLSEAFASFHMEHHFKQEEVRADELYYINVKGNMVQLVAKRIDGNDYYTLGASLAPSIKTIGMVLPADVEVVMGQLGFKLFMAPN